MELIDVVKTLFKIGQTCIGHKLEAGDSIIYDFKSRANEEKTLDRVGIVYDKIGKNEISISLSRYSGLYYNVDHFLQNSQQLFEQQVSDQTLCSNIGILYYLNDKYLYYDSSRDNTFLGLEPDPTNLLIQNTFYYWKIFQDFRSLNIIEYHSVANREFILVSPEKGKFLLGYPSIPSIFPKNIIIKNKYLEMTKINQSQEFRFFFKEQLIDSLSSFNHDQKFPKFVEKLDTIIQASENNYEVFLRKFNFEDLKKNFRKQRDEYFSNIRDIIDQLLGKLVSIPLSVSAAALAIYNLRAEPSYAIIVAIAFVAYSLFASFLLRVLRVDAIEICQDLEKDIDIIKTSSNIPDSILKKETKKVYKKIQLLVNTIFILQLIFAVLTSSVLIVFFQSIIVPLKMEVITIIFVFDLQLLISIWCLGKIKIPIQT